MKNKKYKISLTEDEVGYIEHAMINLQLVIKGALENVKIQKALKDVQIYTGGATPAEYIEGLQRSRVELDKRLNIQMLKKREKED